jgi:dimethylhistidine N-methyltransferase
MNRGFATNERVRDKNTGGNFAATRVPASPCSMEKEVLEGLRNFPKTIHPKYLYDETGSQLFERICETPEYYLTRAETLILNERVGEILARIGCDFCLIEPGAGSCRKARLFLDAGAVTTFVPVDISSEHLVASATEVALSFPDLSVKAVAMDFLDDFGKLEEAVPRLGKRVIFYPGSSIGNFEPDVATRLLSQFSAFLREDGLLLIGYDLRKDPRLLMRAYDDAAGITSEFNLNLLSRLNRELGAEFDASAFKHVALYNEKEGRMEMHLESLAAQEVRIGNETVVFEESERIHTENSYKYRIEEFNGMAAHAGLEPAAIWTDRRSLFAVGLYRRQGTKRPEGPDQRDGR